MDFHQVFLHLHQEAKKQVLSFSEKLIESGTIDPFDWKTITMQQAKDLCDTDRRELDMVFAFEHMECDQIYVKWFKTKLRPRRLMKCLTKWQTALDWNACYFENQQFLNNMLILLATPLSWQPQNIARRFDPI